MNRWWSGASKKNDHINVCRMTGEEGKEEKEEVGKEGRRERGKGGREGGRTLGRMTCRYSCLSSMYFSEYSMRLAMLASWYLLSSARNQK